jgi:hypothetical protein
MRSRIDRGFIYARLQKRIFSMPHRRHAVGDRWALEGHHIVAPHCRAHAYQRIAPQHPGNYRENADSAPPRVGAGWNPHPAPGKGGSPLRALFNFEIRADTCAGAGGDLRVGTAPFATLRERKHSPAPAEGFRKQTTPLSHSPNAGRAHFAEALLESLSYFRMRSARAEFSIREIDAAESALHLNTIRY